MLSGVGVVPDIDKLYSEMHSYLAGDGPTPTMAVRLVSSQCVIQKKMSHMLPNNLSYVRT